MRRRWTVGRPPGPIGTGAESDTRTGWQVGLGVFGWVLAAVYLVWLAVDVGALAVSFSATLVTLAIVIALVAVGGAVHLIGPIVLRRRDQTPPDIAPAPDIDALGRRLADPRSWSELDGELVIASEPDGRRIITPARDGPA